MEIQEFIVKFADQFDDTDANEFNAETCFSELEEWNSFLALAIMAMIKSEYDVAVTAQEMRDSKTIQDLFNIVKSHV
ncbi:MAG: acyl carrier protein [Bacteroidales bacterium]|nr:acyl carrier protein [Bacteroidales bacterium]